MGIVPIKFLKFLFKINYIIILMLTLTLTSVLLEIFWLRRDAFYSTHQNIHRFLYLRAFNYKMRILIFKYGPFVRLFEPTGSL